MTRTIILGCLAASGLVALGWSFGVRIHRATCDPTMVELARRLYKQDGQLAVYESDLAERDQRVAYLEQVNTELKDKVDDAFEFGRLVEREHLGGAS